MLRVHVEHDAGVDGAGVDVHADGALVPFRKVLDAMDRLRLVHRIQRSARRDELCVEEQRRGGTGNSLTA